MKYLGSVVTIQSNRINVNNKAHLNSFNGKKDTLCSKDFMFPDASTEEVEFIDGKVCIDGKPIETDFYCKKCLEIFIKNKSTLTPESPNKQHKECFTH